MDIVEEIKSGNEKIFEDVFHLHYSQLCAYAFSYLHDPDESEEIVQNIFVKIWNKRADFEIKVSFKSYLYQAVKNDCLNNIKHQKVVDRHANEYKYSTEVSVSDEFIATELQKKIQQAVDKLPPERRKIFLMNRHEGKKYKEIATELNISVKTVENQMGKALKFMREELREYITIVIISMIRMWN